MCREPGIVVRLLDQVFGAATLTVKPDHEINGLDEVGDEHPVLVLAGLEQLVLLGLLGFQFLAWLWFAQSHEPVWLHPFIPLVKEIAFPLSNGPPAWAPPGLARFLHPT